MLFSVFHQALNGCSRNAALAEIYSVNSLSASLVLNIFLSFEVGIAHAIANFKWKENTSSLKN